MSEHSDALNKVENNTFTHECPEAECTSLVRCEVAQGKGTCWCFYETPAEGNKVDLHSGDLCKCKSCLTTEIKV